MRAGDVENGRLNAMAHNHAARVFEDIKNVCLSWKNERCSFLDGVFSNIIPFFCLPELVMYHCTFVSRRSRSRTVHYILEE